jgi:SnoaL-like domain
MADSDRNLDLEPPVQAMIDATNAEDDEAFLAAFAVDAELVDWGRPFAGRSEIARWNDQENIGTNNRITVTGVERSGGRVDVAISVTGNGYNGTGTLAFELRGELIQRLVISG